MIRYTPYFRSCESPLSGFTIKYNEISGIQIAIEAINTTRGRGDDEQDPLSTISLRALKFHVLIV